MISYQQAATTKSDIYLHLPVLKKYADRCAEVTEFGVRSVVSTWAFIASNCQMVTCYDLVKHPDVDVAAAEAKKISSKHFHFHAGSTLDVLIAPTNFLFIDTLHQYTQLKAELDRHHSKVDTYLGFHDVVTFGFRDEIRKGFPAPGPGEKQGLMTAILEFMAAHPEWRIDYFSAECNGLLILKRY